MPESFFKASVNTLTGISFALFVGFNACGGGGCDSDMADVKKFVDDYVRRNRRDEEEFAEATKRDDFPTTDGDKHFILKGATPVAYIPDGYELR